jgi:oligopeptidase B
MKRSTLLPFAAFLLLTACGRNPSSSEPTTVTPMPPSVFDPGPYTPPHPEKKAKELLSAGGDRRTDDYYWLNERDNPAVKAYLEAENRYADSVLAPVEKLREILYDEMLARIKQDDNSVPYRKNGYFYYSRFETGQQYPLFCRKKGSEQAPEELMLDVNALALGHPYCQVGGLAVSPDNRWLAYSVDYSGRNLFKGYVKDLTTGQLLPDSFDLAGTLIWANDNQTLFYETKDPMTLRTDRVWRHRVGSDPKTDVMVHDERDETVYCHLSKSKSEAYIFINFGYTQNLETRFLDANKPTGTFEVVRPREKDFFYYVDHWGDKFLIRTNWDAPNFRLMETPVTAFSRDNWKDVLPHRADILLDDLQVFRNHLVTIERKGGLKQIHVIAWPGRQDHYIDIGEPTYQTFFEENPEFDTGVLRYGFSSLKTPPTVVDYDMETRTKTVRKVMPVLGAFDPAHYETELIWATARDGARVPVSVVYKKGVRRDGSAPGYLMGYGSYGFSYDPSFNRDVLSLVDRGFVFGIAHIRGGMEMGFNWYEQGRMANKMNTFYDFIDCAEMLVREKYTSSDRLFASGRSAGGLLMGAVANLRPDLFKGIISGVPFVDVLTTMSDPTIPLTTGEYTEWGNPSIAEQYAWMKAYSPYDNLKAQHYPNLLVLTSFADSQVQYFEPAKWVARLRDLKTDQNLLLFKTNMTGSHGGSSGRFERLKERALEYSWMLGLLGMEVDQKQ